jgi:hypothetical protein
MYRSQSAEPCWFARVVTLARRGRAIAYRELVHQVRLVVGGLTPPGFRQSSPGGSRDPGADAVRLVAHHW